MGGIKFEAFVNHYLACCRICEEDNFVTAAAYHELKMADLAERADKKLVDSDAIAAELGEASPYMKKEARDAIERYQNRSDVGK